ncbi:hypothetical protein Hanom_Chr04g00313841 [Helianthus anomalus]
MKAQNKFTKVQKSMASNSNQVKEVHQLMKKIQFNIARFAKVDPNEITKEIHVESSHQEAPKSNPSATPFTKVGTTMMGPPPNVPRDEMVKTLEIEKPQVITNLKLLASVPKPTVSNDSAISKFMNLETMNEWEQEGDSRKSNIVKRKISKTKSFMVKEIARDVMIFTVYNLVKYYLTKEDEPSRTLSPVRLALREERIKRGSNSIHYKNENPVKRI